ncbi:MAG: hypothetical protein R3C53_27180 [Pirellulaceae bacterium]
MPGVPVTSREGSTPAAAPGPITAPAPIAPIQSTIGPPSTPRPIADQDDWLSLGGPAIGDLTEREQAAAEVKAKKAAAKAAQPSLRGKSRRAVDERELNSIQPSIEPHSRRQAAASAINMGEVIEIEPVSSPSSFDDDDFVIAPLEPAKRRVASVPTDPSKPRQPAPSPRDASGSVFDDDLPELADLAAPPAKRRTLPGLEDLSDLDALIPDLDDGSLDSGGVGGELPSLLGVPNTTDHEYRITCKVCGTPQYVAMSTQGLKIRCPDCFSDFKVPPPPPGWSPTKKKKVELTGEDMPLAPSTLASEQREVEGRRTRTSAIMAKAEQEVTDEDLDRLYDGDFDTAGFVRRTFGFLADPMAVIFVIGYGIVFAVVFAIAQYGLNNRDSGFGRGALLLGVIGAPLLGILFGLPMLSSALALLESVANRQKRVEEWPGFNMFDHFGDMLAIAAALLGALIPGFMVGMWLGGESDGAGRIQIACMMLTTFCFFPVLMLSILDNGSLFQPISGAVLSSITAAAEAWGGYFLKTMIAFSVTMFLWAILLGDQKPPVLAAIAGFLLSPLVFFTFQQLGALADSISEHLSVVFTPKEKEDEAPQDLDPA